MLCSSPQINYIIIRNSGGKIGKKLALKILGESRNGYYIGPINQIARE